MKAGGREQGPAFVTEFTRVGGGANNGEVGAFEKRADCGFHGHFGYECECGEWCTGDVVMWWKRGVDQ